MDSLERCEGLASWDDPESGAFDIEDIRSLCRELRAFRKAVKKVLDVGVDVGFLIGSEPPKKWHRSEAECFARVEAALDELQREYDNSGRTNPLSSAS